jgi:hypothetical protein
MLFVDSIRMWYFEVLSGRQEACMLHLDDIFIWDGRIIVLPLEFWPPFFALLWVLLLLCDGRGRLITSLEVVRRKGTGTLLLLPSTYVWNWLMDNVWVRAMSLLFSSRFLGWITRLSVCWFDHAWKRNGIERNLSCGLVAGVSFRSTSVCGKFLALDQEHTDAH